MEWIVEKRKWSTAAAGSQQFRSGIGYGQAGGLGEAELVVAVLSMSVCGSGGKGRANRSPLKGRTSMIVGEVSPFHRKGSPELGRIRSSAYLRICGAFQMEVSSGFWHSKWQVQELAL